MPTLASAQPVPTRSAARLGGRIGLTCWTPEGFIGRLLATMKPYLPPPPPGALYGPITTARSGLAVDPERAAALDRDPAAVADAALVEAATGEATMGWKYLLVTAVRR